MTANGLTFASLYTGAGGLDAGFIAAGFAPRFSIDINAAAMSTYKATLKRTAGQMSHIREAEHTIVTGDISDHMHRIGRVEADLVIGGPPCQGFSVIGKMDPSDPRSRQVWRFLEAVETITPRVFVMENVKALTANRRWADLLSALRNRASRLGYRTEVLLLNAADYGVPQARERMFLIGLQDDTPISAPRPTSKNRHITVREALSSLPRWGTPGNDSVCSARVVPARRPVLRRSPHAGMLFNGAGRPLRLDMPALTLPASMGGNLTPIVDQQHLDGEGDCWVCGYHKHLLDGNEPHRFAPDRLRRLTIQEAAVLQGFPPDTEWRGSSSSAWRQIGNSVPPSLAQAVAESVAAALR